MNNLQQRLTAIMSAWHVPIDPSCKAGLESLFDSVSTYYGPEYFVKQPVKLREAEVNFEKLLTEMTWQAGSLGFNELHEPTLQAALVKLCPLFPFC